MNVVFNFTTGVHDVAEVTKTNFDSCNTGTLISSTTIGPANIKLATAGEHYYICTFAGHCALGMQLAINVSAAPSTPPPAPTPKATPSPAPAPTPKATPSPAPTPKATPSPSPAPATSPASSPSTAPQTYVVGDSLGWTVPPAGAIAYRTWASNKTFSVGDVLVFNFTTGRHNVVSLTSKAAFDSCNATGITPITTGPARITLTTPGENYYFCAVTGHCGLGQKLAINVTGTASTPAPTPAGPVSTPSPSGSTTPTPPSPSTPSAPPPNSAHSFAGAALPITVLGVALAFFY